MTTLATAETALQEPALRNEPVQARSTARLTALLDATAQIVDEIGFERLTTAMVADRARASIGTVYRYFPDRIAVLQSLAARNLERVVVRCVAEVGRPGHADWQAALSAAFAIFTDGFRDEPGFRSLRTGDVLDLGPAEANRLFNQVLADKIMDALVERFGVIDTPRTRLLLEAAIHVSDGLAARAFARDPEGDERFLELGRATIATLLNEELPPR